MNLEGALKVGVLGLCISMGLPATALAQAPDRIDYQGVLRDPTGQPMNGPVNLVLRIWSSATSQDPVDLLYQETHTGVALIDGVFNVEIGQGITTVGGFDAQLFASAERWLEVEVGGERLAPRERFSSVAYALRAERAAAADNLGGLTPTDVQRRVAGSCPPGQSIRSIGSDGSVVCEPDDDTLYTAGSGITLQGTTFSLGLDLNEFQRRVSGTCLVNQSIRVINQNGTVVCEPDNDANTTYQAGTGLNLTGTVFSIPDGGVTTVLLGADSVTNLNLATSAVDSRVVLDNSLTAADLAAGSVGASEIATNAVGSSEIATGAVTSAEILDGAVTSVDVANGSLPASVLSNGAGGDFAIAFNPSVPPAGATVMEVDLDLPSSGQVIATASGYAVPNGGTLTVICEIRVNDGNTSQQMVLDALGGAENPFGLTRAFVAGPGTVNVSLFCETDHPTVGAIVPIPSLTAVFVPTQY